MQYRKFGKTELEVSEIGFGSWAIGGGVMIGEAAIGWGDADDAVSVRAIHRALDLGINFFDTADIYGLGHSEELLGRTLGGRKDVVIASKAGNVAREGKFTVDYSMEHILSACEASLRRLKRETIDYYQLHTARLSHLEAGGCTQAMERLKKEGKIRYWGLSLNTFEPAPEAEFLMDRGWGSGFQLVLNLLNQKALPLAKAAAQKGYGIIARMPLQFGLLTGKFDTQTVFPANDHRKSRLTPELISLADQALQPVWKLCEKYSLNKTQLALSFILSYPGISTVIPGIRTPAHADMNTRGWTQLDPEDLALIETMGMSEAEPVMELIRKLG